VKRCYPDGIFHFSFFTFHFSFPFSFEIMPAKQGQILQQTQRQLQKLSPQQYLVAKLVELPLTDLEQRVKDEVFENIALEEGHDSADEFDTNDNAENQDDFDASREESDDEFDPSTDNEDADIEYSEAPSDYGNDELTNYSQKASTREEGSEIPIGDTRSFIEDLQAQISEYEVTDKQRELIEYLIGSLDERGFVDRSLVQISDDLLFDHNVQASVSELEDALAILQQFEPCGIGARNLRECLLLQIDRQLQSDDLADEASLSAQQKATRNLLLLERRIIADHFDLFERNDPERLAQRLDISPERLRLAIAAISKLNPHPGRSLHEAADDQAQTIIPDFIVETDHESSISFMLNMGKIPALRVSSEYAQQLDAYQKMSEKLSRSQRDAFIYTRQKVESARMFIAAIKQRQNTLISTMKAIIAFQRDFMLTQDDDLLHPLRLQDVAERTDLDISTISRVVNSKYVRLDGTLYPLKYFFLRSKTNAEGDLIMRTKVFPLIRDIIDEEDKLNPLSDERIAELLQQKGQKISRRTVAKYRDEMDIPPAKFGRRI
jgi:RNA polymerase sigma-54 factor